MTQTDSRIGQLSALEEFKQETAETLLQEWINKYAEQAEQTPLYQECACLIGENLKMEHASDYTINTIDKAITDMVIQAIVTVMKDMLLGACAHGSTVLTLELPQALERLSHKDVPRECNIQIQNILMPSPVDDEEDTAEEQTAE